MNRNSKIPFIPPLKLSASEDAVLRGRPRKVCRAPDDLPDPQAGGESARRERFEDSAAGKDEPHNNPTAPRQPKEPDVTKTAVTDEGSAVDRKDRGELAQSPGQDEEKVQEVTSETTSRVRKLISLFDSNTCTNIRSNELSPRHSHMSDPGETAKFSQEKNNASGGNITPHDNSDLDPSLLDANGYTNGSISTPLLHKEEKTNQNSRTHARRLQQIDENKTSMEPRQSCAKSPPHRNRGTGQKSTLSLVGNLSKEHISRSNTSTIDAYSVKSNAVTPMQRAVPAETCRALKRSRLPVFKPDARTLKDRTVREAFTGSKRTSHVNYIPRQVPPTSSTKIRNRWDESPPKRSSSIGAPGESIMSSSRSRSCRQLIEDVTNLLTDEATELSCTEEKPEGKDPVANFVLHDLALQPPCRPTNRLVFEPRERAIGVKCNPSHHHCSSWHSNIVEPKHGLSGFLSLLWAASAKVFILVTVAASWIVYPLCSPSVLRWIRLPGFLRRCPLPSSSGHLSQANTVNQTGIWNRFWTSLRRRKNLVIRGVILLAVFLCCLELLALDFCQTE